MADLVLQTYDSFRGVQTLGEVWALSQGARTLRCSLSTHPLGWELRLLIGDNLSRSSVCTTSLEVLNTVEVWKAEAVGTGWVERES